MLNNIYLVVASLKYLSLFVCDKHIFLLVSTFYLMKALPVELQIYIDQLLEDQSCIAIITAFGYLHSEWFNNIFCFI